MHSSAGAEEQVGDGPTVEALGVSEMFGGWDVEEESRSGDLGGRQQRPL